MVNKIKLLVAFLLLIAGIAGFYLLADKPTVVRILAVLGGLGAAIAVLWTTPIGQQSLGFIGESVVEARKVVWPTRKETIQTTLVVFVLVVVMAAFLAVVDIGFAFMVQWLMGRGA
ncbi:MAG: preprotein translocase subunit SecE [Methylotenera sp.]|nr:preprotein translocase subunit SecE [Methylotenera sp.]MDD4927324.1 preprotein translocase subunit SecE [Methylotenera sp.]NOS95191.1 preprotein translocase subunit SecE [Methylotenera sp.]NOU41115.1 preprotein translocase subunit SecE [Methylotenera sp.]